MGFEARFKQDIEFKKENNWSSFDLAPASYLLSGGAAKADYVPPTFKITSQPYVPVDAPVPNSSSQFTHRSRAVNFSKRPLPSDVYKYPATNSQEYGWNYTNKNLEIFGNFSANYSASWQKSQG
ncbi:hypothetical protein BJ742DRAFT_780001 [Cladochytrium replicatum]|nr:hypothetical protein BJ742DRAFT_780001 [Cladochytrium replicatum]